MRIIIIKCAMHALYRVARKDTFGLILKCVNDFFLFGLISLRCMGVMKRLDIKSRLPTIKTIKYAEYVECIFSNSTLDSTYKLKISFFYSICSQQP